MRERIMAVMNNIQEKTPLVHNITNYVTVNDCANVQLAFGGSPIMSDCISEINEVTSVCSGLVINIGTLNNRTLDSMVEGVKTANKAGIPVVLDPVGYGFTKLRTEGVDRILKEGKVSVIKGNISEIKGLLKSETEIKGVDISSSDKNLTKEEIALIAKKAAELYSCIIAVTGKIDVISDGKETAFLSNGHPSMSKVTGTGCMGGALLGVSLGGNHEDLFAATVYGVGMIGVCGELASESLGDGNLGTYRTKIIDRIGSIKFEEFLECLNYDEK